MSLLSAADYGIDGLDYNLEWIKLSEFAIVNTYKYHQSRLNSTSFLQKPPETPEKMRFLEGPEHVLRCIDLYDEPPVKIASFRIPPMALRIFVFVSLSLTYIPSVSNCILNVTDFVSLLPAILVVSSNFSITAIYVICLSNRRFIIDSVNQLDDYVRQSRTFGDFVFAHIFLLFQPIFVVFWGTQRRSDLNMNYKVHQKQIAVFSRRTYNFGIGISVVLSVSSLIGPICYAIFGTPEPETWKLPVDVT